MSAARCIGLAANHNTLTIREKSVLSKIISKHKIETRSKKNCFGADKRKEWAIITEEFNTQSDVNKRSTKQLRTCWESMKVAVKRQVINERNSVPWNEVIQVNESLEFPEDIKPVISDVRSLSNNCTSDDSQTSDGPFSNGISLNPVLTSMDSISVQLDTHQNDNINEDVTSHVSTMQSKLFSYETEERMLRLELIKNRINQENELHKLKMKQLQEQHETNIKIQMEKHALYMKHQKELLQLELKQKCTSEFPF